MKIHIKNGRVVDPQSGTEKVQDLYLGAGKIAAIGQAPDGFHANRVIEANGLVVSPGLVDLSARLREPGFEHKATLESEMAAAVAGGVTSLACPPDTDPPLDEPGLVEMLKYRAQNLNLVHVYPLGALTWKLAGERLTEMAVLRDAGCVAFSHADTPLPDTQMLWRALQYAATFGIAVWLRPQDGYLERGGVAHDGEVATRLGLQGIPAFAETIAISTILQLVRATRTRVHLCRLSTAEGVAMVRAAKNEELPITCDIGIHHAHLSEVDLGYFDSHCQDRKSTRLNSSHTEIYTLSLHDALPIYGARGEERGAAHHVRHRHSPRAPLGSRPRVLRLPLPRRAAVPQPSRPRCAPGGARRRHDRRA